MFFITVYRGFTLGSQCMILSLYLYTLQFDHSSIYLYLIYTLWY